MGTPENDSKLLPKHAASRGPSATDQVRVETRYMSR